MAYLSYDARMRHRHHTHLPIDTALLASDKGVRALKNSLIILMGTACLQAVIVYFSHSAALLGDTLHNAVDAFTAVPLWVAFAYGRRKPTARFTYGFHRLEDIAGLFIIGLIFATAAIVGYESFVKFKSGSVPQHIPWVMAGAVIGFIGNEWVARLRIRVGREINSAALIADGQHARADGYTSLGVLIGAIGVLAGFPLADALTGFVLAALILKIGWDNGRELFHRLADAVSPDLVKAIRTEVLKVPGVLAVHDARARHSGHNLHLEITIEVDGNIRVFDGHEIAIRVQHDLQLKFPYLVSPTIHVDPQGHPGEAHHLAAHHHPPH
jgi:cation diffusion facilitator family transporter